MKIDRELSIGEVAARAKLNASAIRYYESEGLLPASRRRSGRRVYDPSILNRLAVIDMAKRCGFSVAEIRQLLAGLSRKSPPGVRWRNLASKKITELDQRIAEAQQMKSMLGALSRCECPTLNDCGLAVRGQG